MEQSYRGVNQKAWAVLAEHGCQWTQPFGPDHFARAREILDPQGWINWDKIKSVLCLACGGGQQAPLFASLGHQVTALDLSSVQIQKDEEIAKEYGLELELIQADMLDLSLLYGRDFDFVYQPVSAVYIPDVIHLYREIFKVTRSGGHYRVEHWNPVYVQMPETDEWDGSGYRIVRPQTPGSPVPQTAWRIGDEEVPILTWQYIHPLDHLLGGLCDSGFNILRFAETSRRDENAEPGTAAHVAAYVPATFALFARRT